MIWTEEQNKLLIEEFADASEEELVKKIGKSWEAITSKAYILGLRRNWYKLPQIGLTERQIGYLAAAIDGEGSISLILVNKNYKRARNPYLRPVIEITNTQKSFIKKIEEMLSVTEKLGFINVKPKYFYGPRKKPLYRFIAQRGRRCRAILELVLPELTARREQAELLMEFCGRRAKNYKHKKNVPYDKREWEIYYQLRELNGGNIQ